MIINTTQVEMVLNNKAIPAYSLEAETGVSRDRISKLRRGDIKFENMSLKTIMKIQKWIDDGIKIVSPNSPKKFMDAYRLKTICDEQMVVNEFTNLVN